MKSLFTSLISTEVLIEERQELLILTEVRIRNRFALVTMVTRLVLGYRRRLVRRCSAIAPVVVCARHRFIPHTSYPSRRPDASCRGAPRRQEGRYPSLEPHYGAEDELLAQGPGAPLAVVNAKLSARMAYRLGRWCPVGVEKGLILIAGGCCRRWWSGPAGGWRDSDRFLGWSTPVPAPTHLVGSARRARPGGRG